jgi:hypothetical protein
MKILYFKTQHIFQIHLSENQVVDDTSKYVDNPDSNWHFSN